MFIDEIKLDLKAGRGGDGVVRWRHEKGKELSGAGGGDGGRGGSVYFKSIRDIGALRRYRNKKSFSAVSGAPGSKNSMHGLDGDDLVLDVPVGSIITDKKSGKVYELLKEGEQVMVLKGGVGGYGNEHFKASTNTTPYEFTEGKEGEEAKFEIELQLIIDAGLVGFPNAGKSSLLNELTNANAKVGDWEFTTLEPNLGSLYGFIIADIPGLIEGAAEGKGLGHKFLRHINRTKMIIHCISLENKDVVGTYKTIRAELEAFNEDLAKKPEIVVLTKTDLADKSKIESSKKGLLAICPQIETVSVLDDSSIKEFSDKLQKYM